MKTRTDADKLNTYQQRFKSWTAVDIWFDSGTRWTAADKAYPITIFLVVSGGRGTKTMPITLILSWTPQLLLCFLLETTTMPPLRELIAHTQSHVILTRHSSALMLYCSLLRWCLMTGRSILVVMLWSYCLRMPLSLC
jgi:hypothetical protein